MSVPEDAGSIVAEIRLGLTQLQKDALAAEKTLSGLTKNLNEQGKKGGELYVQGFGKAQQNLNNRLNTMVTSLQSVSPKMGALGVKMAGAFSKPIFSMVPMVQSAFKAMLPIIGTVIVAVCALFKIISVAAKSQKEFADNVELSREVSMKLKNSTEELNKEQQKAADITARQERNTAVMRVAFQKLGDFFKNVFLPIINGVRSAFTAIGDAVSWVADKLGIVSDSEAKAAVEAQKLVSINTDLNNVMDNYEKQLKEINTLETIGLKTASEAADAKVSAMESYINSLVIAREEAAKLTDEEGLHVKELDIAIAGLNTRLAKLKESAEIQLISERTVKAVADYEKQLKNIETAARIGAINDEQRNSSYVSAKQKILDDLVKELSLLDENNARHKLLISVLNKKIDAIKQERDLAVEIEGAERRRAEWTKRVVDGRKSADDTYNAAVRKANREKEIGQINELQRLEKIKDAEIERYHAYRELQIRENVTSGITADKANEYEADVKLIIAARERIELDESYLKIKEQLAEQEIDRQKAIAKSAKTEAERNAALDEAIMLENELIQAQRDKEWAIIEATNAYKEYVASVGDGINEIERDFKKVTAQMKKTRDDIDKNNKNPLEKSFLDLIFGEDEEAKKAFNNIMQVGQAALDVYQNIADAEVEIARGAADRKIKIIEGTLTKTLDAIEKERKARLIAQGFAVEGAVESYEQQQEAAKRTGDEILIYQAQRRLEEQRINDEFDAKAKQAENDAANEKVQLEYEVAIQEWQNKKINAMLAGIMAVINALASHGIPWPIASSFGVAAGAATANQIRALNANPPQPPQKFHDGGIVRGRSLTVDDTPAMLTHREGVFTLDDQEYLFDQIQERKLGGGSVQATLVVMLDSREIAKSTVNLVNDGFYTIKARAIR